MEFDATVFERMFACVAFGLHSKLNAEDEEHYMAGLLFRQGVNLYARLALQYYGDDAARLEYVNAINETSMILKNCTSPVREWFVGWKPDALEALEKLPFYHLDALVICSGVKNAYLLSGECEDFLNASEKDLTSIEEHIVYDKMKELPQELYVDMRRFLIEHPLLSKLDRIEFLVDRNNDSALIEVVKEAYEPIPADVYICPNCGWTLSMNGRQPVCCHRDCMEKVSSMRGELKTVGKEFDWRLKKGVMRYICYPGRAELELKEAGEKLGLAVELWPERDRYDLKITFSDGTSWGIDAKTYASPYLLSQSIKQDFDFQSVALEKKFYVISDGILKKHKGYLRICNDALKGRPAECVSMRNFKRNMKKEAEKDGSN